MRSTDIKELNSPVAENVKRIISESGMKQYAIARKIGYTSQELTDMIYGRRIIKISDIPKFCSALDVDVGMLFRTEQGEKVV